MGGTWKAFSFGNKDPYADWRHVTGSDRYWGADHVPTGTNAGQLAGVSRQKIIVQPDTVILAIIDDAMGFANERFRQYLTHSRLEALWIMDAKDPATGQNQYGSVLQNRQIDQLLNRFLHSNVVDEDALYKHLENKFDLYPDMRRRSSHGTHSLDLLAGTDFRGHADDPLLATRPILAVQLPRAAIQDSSGTRTTPYILDAINWILDYADRFETADGQLVPLVCSFSFGLYAGGHDGNGAVERAIARIATRGAESGQTGLSAVVVPAGNSFQSRTHAQPDLTTAMPARTLTWAVPPDDKLASFVEFWLPVSDTKADSAEMSLTITTPGGEVLREQNITGFQGGVLFGQGAEWCNASDLPVMRCYHRNTAIRGTATSREQLVLALLPTTTPDGELPVAASGDWQIEITLNRPIAAAETVEIEAWIQRGGRVYCHPLIGRQSVFKDPEYVFVTHGGFPAEKDSVNAKIKRAGTLSGMATAKGAVVAGGYRVPQNGQPGPVAPYSSAGSPRFGAPDIAAPTEQGLMARGVLASGSFTGSQVALSGTSAAAPQVAAYLADQLGNLPTPPAAGIKQMLRDQAASQDPDAPAPDSFEALRLGSGRLPVLEKRLTNR